MRSSRLLAALPLLGAARASENLPRDSTGCSDVHVFLARGNNEPYPGRQAKLVQVICAGLESCDYEDLVYSALYTDLYCQTVYDGTIAGHVQMAAYASRCPNSKLILSGYSQGAQIATDILAGGGATLYNGCVQPSTPALSRDTAPGNMIVAAIVFGNVRHTANQPYNYGNGSAINSQFPRDSDMLSALDGWSGILRDWCLNTDGICAVGQSVSYLSSHLGYFDNYSEEAGAWVKSVASLAATGTQAPVFPLSLSGTAQDYATIGTETPSGGVVINTVWTDHTAVTPVATSSTPSSTKLSSTSTAASSTTTSGSLSATTKASTSESATGGASAPVTTSPASSAATTSPAATTTSTNSAAGSGSRMDLLGAFVAILGACLL
ncbi:alpha/beta-hydrolase [Thozetella sp. PMI_491]|nr:alpha/beta-hydrolase [Thozetella sp. PMI_491]